MSAADLFDLTGKVALVTGGNSGLGLGFARGMAKCGADIVIWGRRADANQAAEAELLACGAGRVFSQVIDVSQEAQIVNGMANAVEVMGRLDCVVQNAGTATQVPTHEMTYETYNELLAVSQHGGFFTVREAVRHMRARALAGDPGGSILLCGSLTQFRGEPGLTHYAAAKGAMEGIMRTVAVEYGEFGVRANMVCVGYAYTPLYGGHPKEVLPMDEMLRTRNPIRRWGETSDVEGIAAYLASNSAGYHTGDVIVIDGGTSVILP
jgi:NAD(P)-dependent dehydrogenase (short-subunit alcohol dehydrogenase family)